MPTEKENFRIWMRSTNKLSEGSIDAYSSKIDTLSRNLKSKSMIKESSLYDIKNLDKLSTYYNQWLVIPEFIQSNEKSHKQESNAFRWYIDFWKHNQKSEIIVDNFDMPINQIEEVESIQEKESYLFALEEHLQDFLIANLSTIKKHKLKLYDDGERKGKEYPTEVGLIDILTIDENGDFYVFETKLYKGMDKALGQLLRYMGWVNSNLPKGKKYLESLSQIKWIRKYSMQFQLHRT